jgi:hypothetical protein
MQGDDLMKLARTALAVLAPLLATSAGFAATPSSVTGTVTQIQGDSNGYYYVYFSTTISGQPACATNHTVYVINASTTAGAAEMSVAQVAYGFQQSVTATGLGTCNVYGPGIETMAYIVTNTPPP